MIFSSSCCIIIRQYKSDKKPFKNRTADGESNENQLLYYPPLTPRLFTTLVAALLLFTGCMTGDDSKTTEYKLSFSANGGSGTIASISVEEGSEITLPENTFTKTGYSFAGWATSADGNVSYSDKAKISITGNIMLYAKWTVAAENAVNAINSLPTGEHKIAVTGQMTKDNLNGVIEAIKGNSNGAKVYLDLGGITVDFYDWIKCSFKECENLIGIVIPSIEPPDNESQYILIPDLMFEGCKNLKTVIILNSSGEYKIITFKDCTSLEYVEIPTSIVCIYSDAFDGCTALETITYKGTVEQWKQVKTDFKDPKYKLMSLNVQCENGTASGSDLIKE